MEFALSSKYSRKCNKFSIVIVNKLHDWWRCHWQTWTEVMYKARQSFCLDLFLQFVQLFCDVMQITSWKQKVPCIMCISILGQNLWEKSAYYTWVNTVFCFVLYHQSWGSTYTQVFKNIIVFGLKNGGRLIHESTYTRENTVTVPLLSDSVHKYCIFNY